MSSLSKQFVCVVLVVCLTVAASFALTQDGGRRGANAGPVAVQPKSAPAPPSTLGAGAGGANMLAGIRPFPRGIGTGPSGGPQGTHGYLMSASPFGVSQVLPNFVGTALLSGLSKQPGSLFFSLSGSFGDGGNVYHFPPGGPFIMAGPGASGPDLAGLAYDSTGALWASGDAATILDGLFSVDIASGIATPVGLYGGALGGVGAIAEDPTTNVLYGFTGFFYDASPGDVLIIDRTTGTASDTGIDLTDASGGLPSCTIAGATFAADGTGYASIGCHYSEIIEFQTLGAVPFQFAVIGSPFEGIGVLHGGSMSDIEVVF